MIEQIYTYFTIETLYMWVNLGVLPFWFILIFFPQSYLCRYFVVSIFPIFILSGAYIFTLYKSYQLDYNLFLGGWIVKDAQKFYINKTLLAIPLLITYLIGPVGLFIYWIIRIFYAKKMSLYE